jgi:4-hydroxybenzoate polyprenyltransferase
MTTTNRIDDFLKLIRWDKPIGTLLLLWPTLAALWLASAGHVSAHILFAFIAGVFLLRAAGCIMNDIADRDFDCQVARTKDRPITAGKISVIEAMIFCGVLLSIALGLALTLNQTTIMMAVAAGALAAVYPLLKRITHLPQLGLGVAFNWSILMAFTATQNTIPLPAVLFFLAGVLITIAYDTLYAVVDQDDDVSVGIKSTAILFGQRTRLIVAALQIAAFALLMTVGWLLQLNGWYYAGVFAWAALIAYQHMLVRSGQREQYFAAFLNNNWSWLMLFLGIVLAYSH